MKLSIKTILPIILISALLILLSGCFLPTVPSPGYTPKDIIGKIETPKECCDTSKAHMSGWVPMVGATVILTDDSGKVIHTTTTEAEGKYQFTNVDPGLYIITAICPLNEEYLVKDVVDKVAGDALNAGTTDCQSTALALVVEYLLDIYDEDNECFGKGTDVYEQVKRVAAEYESLNLEGIDLAAIKGIKPEFDADLVDMICYCLESCCTAPEPGFTPEPEPEPGDTPPPYDPGPGPSGVVLLRIEFDPQAMTICMGDTRSINSLKAFYSDGSEINLLGNSSLIVTFTNGHATFNKNNGEVTGVSVGSTTFTATFGGKSDTLDVTVTHPTAEAGGPYTGEACSGSTVEITLNGSDSTAGGAAITDWEWYIGGSLIGSGETLEYDFAPDSYTVTLIVTDNNDCTDTDTATVKITELTPPTAEARGPYTGEACPGSTVKIKLDGSCSTAGSAAITDWEWYIGGSLIGSGETLEYDFAPDSYTVTLIVTDNNDCTDTDTATVKITELTPPTAEARGPYTGEACPGSTVKIKLDGSCSTAGSAAITDWEWYIGGSLIGSGETLEYDFAPDSYTVTLIVTDNNDCTDTDTATVKITELTPPTAEARGPYTGEACPGSTVKIKLDGSCSTAGSAAITDWEWYIGGSLIGSGETLEYDFAPDSYTVTLIVTDNNDCTDTDTATVKITKIINNPPVIGGIPTQRVVRLHWYSYTIPASDLDGHSLSYEIIRGPKSMTINNDGLIGWRANCNYCLDPQVDRCIKRLICTREVIVKVTDDGPCQPSFTTVTFNVEVWNYKWW